MIIWTDYFKYKVQLRGFDLKNIEEIMRFSEEKYFDNITHRSVVIGRHGKKLVLIPYEKKGKSIIPVTIHATTRQQINFRIKTGRFQYE